MANYKPLGTNFDRTFRNDLNENFSTLDVVAEKAKLDSTTALTEATDAKSIAQGIESKATQALSNSGSAINTANQANTTANNVQTQLNNVIIESGTSDAEVVQARGTATVLNERLNGFDELSVEKTKQASLDFSFFPTGAFNFVMYKGETLAQLKSNVDYISQFPVVKNILLSHAYDVSDADTNVVTRDALPQADLISLIDYIKSKGINIFAFKTHMSRYPGKPTGNLAASSNPRLFTQNYLNLIVADAQVAKDAGIGYVNLSNELLVFTNQNADLWNDAITSIKALGLKTYSSFAGTKELDPCVFASNLDVIGLNWYPKLSDKGYDATLDSCREYLINNEVDYLVDVKKRYNKPIWITETGSTRYENALSAPETFAPTPTTSNIIQYLYHNSILPFLGSLMYNEKPVIDLVNIFALHKSTEKYSVLGNDLAREVVEKYFSNNYNVLHTTVDGNGVVKYPHTVPFQSSKSLVDRYGNVIDLGRNQISHDTVSGASVSVSNTIQSFLKGTFKGSISNVSGVKNPVITLTGKNLISKNSFNTHTGASLSIVNDDEVMTTVTSSATYTSTAIKPFNVTIGKRYVFRCKYKVLSGNDKLGFAFKSLDGTTSYSEAMGRGGKVNLTITPTVNQIQLILYTSYGTANLGGVVRFYDFQIEQSDEDTPYERNIDRTISIPYEMFDSDVFDFSTGKLAKNQGKVVFNGTEAWALYATATNQTDTISFRLPMANVLGLGDTKAPPFYCDKFTPQSISTLNPTDAEAIGYFPYPNYIVIRVNRSKLVTHDVAGFQSWLASNNVTLIYKYSTPVNYLITNDLPRISSKFSLLASSDNSQAGTFDVVCPKTKNAAMTDIMDVVSKIFKDFYTS